MSAEQDRHFFDTFMIVLGVLVAFTIGIYFLANAIGAQTQVAQQKENPLKAQQIAARLAPAASVAVAGQEEPAAMTAMAAATEPVAAAAKDGEAIYNSACLACHALGVAGAPKFADKAVWAPRIAKGVDTLYANAIDGYQGEAGYMPAKGGRMDLSDDEVRTAVDFMVTAAR